MLTRAELEGWSHEERSALMRLLIELEVPAVEPTAEQRRLGVAVRTLVTGGAVLLVPWTIYLAMSLPHRTVTSQWRGAWVGFDLLLVVALALTAWLGWRGRQLVVIGLVSSAVLLICDAWFDVTLTSGEDKRISYLTALFVALPVAALFIRAARLISQASDRFVWNASGRSGPVPPLHRMPLVMRLRDGSVGLDDQQN